MHRGSESNVGNWTYCETCWEEISRIVTDYLKGDMRYSWKMVDYLKKALIYGHTSRISS